jgi:hypothetical protein
MLLGCCWPGVGILLGLPVLPAVCNDLSAFDISGKFGVLMHRYKLASTHASAVAAQQQQQQLPSSAP